MPQCLCLKTDGKQCTREATKKVGSNHLFCWQHQKCQNVKLADKVSKKIPLSATIITGEPMMSIGYLKNRQTQEIDQFMIPVTYFNGKAFWLVSNMIGEIMEKNMGKWIEKVNVYAGTKLLTDDDYISLDETKLIPIEYEIF